MDASISHLTDEEIIALCESPTAQLLSDRTCSTKVVKVLPTTVVKYGFGVTFQEFSNQQIARQRLNPTLVHVPPVHRYIRKGDVGYILMDYVPGNTLNPANIEKYGKRLSQILRHLHEMQGEVPGPFNSGPIQGVLWSELEEIRFGSLDELEEWLSRRLLQRGKRISLQEHTLVMCHGDFVPRNIIIHEGTISLIDWSAAGYFPRFFERISHRFSPLDAPFYKSLERYLDPLNDTEQRDAELVVKACTNGLTHFL
jgi:aminoglycoside phosphotransferase